MTVAVSRLEAGGLDELDGPLASRPRLPFTRGYDLPPEGSRRWLKGIFAEALRHPAEGAAFLARENGRPVAGLTIARAAWESSVFGVSMGRIPFVLVGDEDDATARRAGTALLAEADRVLDDLGIRHVSALVLGEDTGLIHAFGDAGWRLVDSTVEFTWACGRTSPAGASERLRLRPFAEADRKPLAELARESYTRSIRTRFAADPWLPVETTGELYARWFHLACDGEFGDVVVVAEVDGEAVGFNTFKLDRSLSEATGVGFASHGIAAVHPAHRGLKGQPAMLHWLTEWQRERGGSFNRGRVLISNHSMQSACLKSGAYMTQSYHTFHRWRGAPPVWPAGKGRP